MKPLKGITSFKTGKQPHDSKNYFKQLAQRDAERKAAKKARRKHRPKTKSY